MTTERIQKVLAHAGVASRRAVERLILEGRVRVNGEVIHELGVQVDLSRDAVDVDGRLVPMAPRAHSYVVLYKPIGMVSTAHDPQGRPTVVQAAHATATRLYPVGRLDADSEGLVLLTDDGALTYRLTHARYGVEKEYHVLVRCALDRPRLRRLTDGVELEDGLARAVRAEMLRETRDGTWVSVVLHEGRKREVRRMLAAIGCPLLRLLRVRLGPIDLGSLHVGESRPLTPSEVAALKHAAGLEE